MESKKNKNKILFWFFHACFTCSKENAKQNAKIHFLFQKYYSYISLKKAKTNKVGSTKK
jgi:hypothetical protein